MKIIQVSAVNSMNKTQGCEKAPKNIIEDLRKNYGNEAGKIIDKRLLDVEEIDVERNNLESQNREIYKKSKKTLKENDKIFFLGGDHSISFPIGRAFLDFCEDQREQTCLVVFDAHADCIKPGKEPTHEEWLRGLIESGFPAENVLLVGARHLWKEEIEFVSKNKIKRISMNDLNNNLEEITDTIMEFASGKKLYVSLDIDVVDPVFAPGTGYLEVGGLTSRQLIYIVSRISKMKNLKIVDLVEVNPSKDKEEMTVKLAAKLLSELL